MATTSPTKSSEAAAEAGAIVVIDALDEVARAKSAGVRTVLVRVTPGIDAETHRAVQTAHARIEVRARRRRRARGGQGRALAPGLDVAGLHVHIGSQLTRSAESLLAVERLANVAAHCREELGWTPRVFDLGGGLAVRHSLNETVPQRRRVRAGAALTSACALGRSRRV